VQTDSTGAVRVIHVDGLDESVAWVEKQTVEGTWDEEEEEEKESGEEEMVKRDDKKRKVMSIFTDLPRVDADIHISGKDVCMARREPSNFLLVRRRFIVGANVVHLCAVPPR
jgi:hypothetical protein